MFATILYWTEQTKRLFDTMLVIVDDILFDCRLEFLVAMVDAPNEGISIIENVARMGLPIPQKLQDMMHSLKDK